MGLKSSTTEIEQYISGTWITIDANSLCVYETNDLLLYRRCGLTSGQQMRDLEERALPRPPKRRNSSIDDDEKDPKRPRFKPSAIHTSTNTRIRTPISLSPPILLPSPTTHIAMHIKLTAIQAGHSDDGRWENFKNHPEVIDSLHADSKKRHEKKNSKPVSPSGRSEPHHEDDIFAVLSPSPPAPLWDIKRCGASVINVDSDNDDVAILSDNSSIVFLEHVPARN
jgi:hypothetical protein